MEENIKFFVFIGVFSTIVVCLFVIISLGMVLHVSFRNWRRNKCKIKCLCKHTYNINWIAHDEDMLIECITCHAQKKLHFDKKSLKAFLR